MTTVGIHQPNYFPWVGYFHKIARSEKFIFLDDVQYSKGSYINRTQYLFNDDVLWLTVPCKPKLGTLIQETRVANDKWQEQHLNKIKSAYSKCLMFSELWPTFQNWLSVDANKNLSDINIYLIKEICIYLDIKTEFYRSSEIDTGQQLTASERLVKLTNLVGGREYFSGRGAKKYQDESLFVKHRLPIIYSSFVEMPRAQNSTCFQHGLSILDLILNVNAFEAKSIISAKG